MQRNRTRTIDVVALLGFSALWLLPMAWGAYLGESPSTWPARARDLYSVSCLFGPAFERVSTFYVQVRYADREGWYDLDEHEYFSLEPFGHRTRFDRFMARFAYQEDSTLARRELALWLVERERTTHPERSPIVAVRYVWADRLISADDPPREGWRKPPRSEAGIVHQLGEIVVVDGQVQK